MTKAKLLFADNDLDFLHTRKEFLEREGYQVVTVSNPIEARKILEQGYWDLAILDIRLEDDDDEKDVSGLVLAREAAHAVPKIILTNFPSYESVLNALRPNLDGLAVAVNFVGKEEGPETLVNAVKTALKQLKRSSISPFAAVLTDSTLSIACQPDDRMVIRVQGSVTLNTVSQNLLKLKTDVHVRQGNNIPLLDWRFDSKQVGRQLYEKVFVTHPEIHGNYSHVLGKVKEERNLHIRFESNRNFLTVPLESIFATVDGGEDYLVLYHPLSRSIKDVRTLRPPISPRFFTDLWDHDQILKILLIGSNTYPHIPGVDAEIDALTSYLPRLFEERGISVEVKTIPTEEATYEIVRSTLQRCQYHIIHYAGHGTYEKQSSEKSYISLWEQEGKQGDIKKMPISELQMLLRGSGVCFVYLSCCSGTQSGEPGALLDNDFLGIADGIIHAGVPAVLGFRWPVSDDGAKTLALAFYKSLAEQGQLDTALLDARCEVAARNRDDITWLSPILITQG